MTTLPITLSRLEHQPFRRQSLWGSRALAGIAVSAGRNNVITGVSAAFRNWDHVIHRQPFEFFPAVRAFVVVGHKDCLPLLLGQGCNDLGFTRSPKSRLRPNDLGVGSRVLLCPQTFLSANLWVGGAVSRLSGCSLRSIGRSVRARLSVDFDAVPSSVGCLIRLSLIGMGRFPSMHPSHRRAGVRRLIPKGTGMGRLFVRDVIGVPGGGFLDFVSEVISMSVSTVGVMGLHNG